MKDISLSRLWRNQAMSSDRLFDQTPHQCLLWHRVQRAKEMLSSAKMRVLDVAIAYGFETQQHFARIFRQMCGASPKEYRHGRFWGDKPVRDIVEEPSSS